MSEPFGAPATPGTGVDLKELNGALLLITVHGVEKINTAYGPSDAIRCDIDALDGPSRGDTYTDTLLFPKVLYGQLKASVGGKVLGRLGQGTAKPGQSPPWILAEATPADIAVGKQFLAGQLQSVPASSPPF